MNRLQKLVVTGALILAPVLSVGAASAAPANNETVTSIAQKYGFDLSSLLQGANMANAPVYMGGIVLKYPFPYGSGSGNAGHWIQFPSGGKGTGSAPSHNNSSNSGSTAGDAANGGPTAGQTGNTAGNSGTTGSSAGTDNTAGSSQETADTGSNSSTSSSYASQVVDLVNQERAKAGLKPLTSDSALTNVALVKAKDMYTNNYFDHTSPTYGSPFDMMKSFGISYSYAGENIAKGQRDPQEVMTAWMNSEGHRQNILSPNYTKIGVAYYNGEWVQEFIAN